MNHELLPRPSGRLVFWDIGLAALLGGFVFVILLILTGGVLISLITAAAAFFVFGLLHYWVWGQALLKNVIHQRETAEAAESRDRDQVQPADEFMLVLNDQERVELIATLEHWLAETPIGTFASGRAEAIRRVLDRLRGFGA